MATVSSFYFLYLYANTTSYRGRKFWPDLCSEAPLLAWKPFDKPGLWLDQEKGLQDLQLKRSLVKISRADYGSRSAEDPALNPRACMHQAKDEKSLNYGQLNAALERSAVEDRAGSNPTPGNQEYIIVHLLQRNHEKELIHICR